MTVHAWHGAFGMPTDWNGLRGQPHLVDYDFRCPLLWEHPFPEGIAHRGAGILPDAKV